MLPQKSFLLLLLLFIANNHVIYGEESRNNGFRLTPRKLLKQPLRHTQSLDIDIFPSNTSDAVHHEEDTNTGSPSLRFNDLRCGGDNKEVAKRPSFYWAVFHNWMYFLSLGFNAVNIQFLVREIIDGSAKASPSPKSIALSGNVEAVDKILTFAGVGVLSALSDKYGRRPLMIWSSLGFMFTNLIQATTKSSIGLLYVADFVDGCTSCMLPLCQAYITDVSPPDKMAINLGIFQGLSAGGAFILAFPIGGILGAKLGPRVPLYAAAGLQLLNSLVLLFLTPESHTNRVKNVNLWEDNPIGALKRLFGGTSILRYASAGYFLSLLGKASLDAQFVNYSNIRFGWSQAKSGPILVIVGLMLAIAPRIFVPLLGLRKAILTGILIFAAGLAGTGLAPTPTGFISGILVSSVGCMCLPAFQALLASLAKPNERGALLGAVGSINELTGAIGSTLHARILATFTSENPPLPVPGMHFVFGSAMLLLAWAVSFDGFVVKNKNHPALISVASRVPSVD